jgi:hypothetical protein
MVDIVIPAINGSLVYFAQPDAIRGTLKDTILVEIYSPLCLLPPLPLSPSLLSPFLSHTPFLSLPHLLSLSLLSLPPLSFLSPLIIMS